MNQPTIISYPAVSSLPALHDLRARLAYYFAPLSPASIVVPVKPWLKNIASVEFRLPNGFDEQIQHELFELEENFLSPTVTDQDYSDFLRAADAILIWDVESPTPDAHTELLESAKAEGRLWRVDPANTRMEGSFYFEAIRHLSPVTAEERARFNQRFEELFFDLRDMESVHLLGSGPSISEAFNHAFEETITIGCNTVILNDELLRHTGLDILVFADPIFHFGCSTYAANFRKALVKQVEVQDAWVVIPEKYLKVLLHYCPSIADRVIPVPMHGTIPNVDLTSEFRIMPVANILTLLQLPLSVTLNPRDVYLVGYDGRAANDSGFWRHNPTTQLVNELSTIQRIHPGFFAIDYEDYYEEHLKTLDQLLRYGEDKGVNFWCLGSSHIPALKQRRYDGRRSAILPPGEIDDVDFLIVSVNPDLRDSWGHFKHYDDVVSRAASESGARAVTFANRGVGSEFESPWCWPIFVHNSWSVSRKNPSVYEQQFLNDLKWALGELAAQVGDSIPIQLFMYVGHWRHVQALLEAVAPYENMSAFVNLFLCHKELQDAAERGDPSACAAFVSMFYELLSSAGVRLHVDSPQCRDLLEEQAGVSVPLWPMFSVSDLEAVTLEEGKVRSGRESDSPVRVYAPGGASKEKGFDLTVQMAVRLEEVAGPVEASVRAVDARQVLKEWPELAKSGVRVVAGDLSAPEYAHELNAADILVLPYRLRPFRTRTSGLVSDGLMLGKPMIAAKGTWGGNLVESFGLGATFPDGDADGLMEAVKEVVQRLDYFEGRACAASEIWQEEARPSRLIDLLRPVEPHNARRHSRQKEPRRVARQALVGVLKGFGSVQLRSSLLGSAASGPSAVADGGGGSSEVSVREIAGLEARAEAAEARYEQLRSRLIVRSGLKATDFVKRRLPLVLSFWEIAKRRRRVSRSRTP